MKKIKKAIICAGGFGTRFLPFTNFISKEMLPVGGVPAIQRVVQECIDACFEKIIIVTRTDSNVIKKHFSPNRNLLAYLEKNKKYSELEKLEKVFSFSDRLSFVEESTSHYGNAVPLLTVQSYLEDDKEPFAVLFGDDVVLNKGISELVNLYQQNECEGIVAVQKVPLENMGKFGNVDFDMKTRKVKRIVQKPSINEIVSEYALVSRLILTPNIFRYMTWYKNEPDLGSAIAQHCLESDYLVAEIEGWVNLDDPISYHRANQTYYQKKRGD